MFTIQSFIIFVQPFGIIVHVVYEVLSWLNLNFYTEIQFFIKLLSVVTFSSFKYF